MQDLVVRNLECQHHVDRAAQIGEQAVERARLVQAARVAVEQETGVGTHRRETGAQQLLDDRVGDELAALDVPGRGVSERGSRLDLRAQQVAGGDAIERERLDERGHERALACARRPDEHDLKRWRWLRAARVVLHLGRSLHEAGRQRPAFSATSGLP